VGALGDPARLREAQELIARVAPQLQRILGQALDEGGWFGSAHEQAVAEATREDDHAERQRLVHVLIAEETRVGMLVGAAVGYQLAHELERAGPGARDD
jgi:hypothetical protein